MNGQLFGCAGLIGAGGVFGPGGRMTSDTTRGISWQDYWKGLTSFSMSRSNVESSSFES